MQTQQTQPVGMPTGSVQQPSTISAFDEFGNPVQVPNTIGQTQVNPLQLGLEVGGPGGPGHGARGGAAVLQGNLGNIGKQAIYYLGGFALVTSVLKGLGGRGGELANNFWSYLSDLTGMDFTDAGVRNKIIKDAYVTPFENPVTGKLEFLDPDGKLLEESARNQGLGITTEKFKILKAEWDAEKADNKEKAAIFNSGLPEGWQRPGESALTATTRFLGVANKAQENAFIQNLAGQQPGNAQGLTAAQVQQANQQFAAGQTQAEVIRQKKETITGVKQQEQIDKLPPGTLTPDELERIAAKKLPNEVLQPSGPPAAPVKQQPGLATPATPASLQFSTKAQFERARGQSVTEEEWNRYLRTGRFK